MLDTTALKEWLEDAGLSFAVSEDELPEGAPHNVVAVSISGGLGLETEGALDNPSVSALIRGANGGIAETNGQELDRLLLTTSAGFYIGDAYCLGFTRFGGPPAFIGKDGSEKYPNRYLRQATYIPKIEY